jgi:hypothetical protein
MWHLIPFALVILLQIGVLLPAVMPDTSDTADDLGAAPGTWYPSAGNLRPAADAWGVRVPSLASCDTIDTDGDGIFTCGTDLSGTGGTGLATSTAIADTYVIYGTSAGTVGAEAAFTYDDATDKLTVVNASTTAVSATTFTGALVGNVTGTATYAGALSANGGNCSAGNAPLGVDASGAVESCFDVWTEAENTSAAYITSSALTPYLTLAAFYATTTQDIAEGGTNLYWTSARATSAVSSLIAGTTTTALAEGSRLYYTDARVASYILGSTTLCTTLTGSADLCDGVDNEGSGGSSEHYDAGSYVYPLEGDYHSAPHNVASSTSATSTFTYLSIGNAVSILGEYFTNFTTYVRSLFTGDEGITITSGGVSFDCSEVEGTGINCTGEDITLDATGDWTGTIDGNNFSGGAIGSGQMLYGTGAGTLGELTLGASSTLLTTNGTAPLWMAGSALCVAITGSADLCDGSDASGTGSGVTASSTATYIVYKQGTTYYAYNASTTAVTSNSDFDVLLASLVGVIDVSGTGGIIHIKSGDYYADAVTTIAGNDSGSYNNGGRITIAGDGTDSTRIIMNNNADFLDFEDAAIFTVRDLSVYVKGSSDAFVSDSNDNDTRAAWMFEFSNIHVAATTTHTGFAFDLGNVFRGRFENIEMFEVHNCMRFTAEGAFNPGDFVLSRSFCELDNTANGVAYWFAENGTGFMNQMHFEVVEGIAQNSGAKFIYAEDLSFTNFYNLNAEQFDYLVDVEVGAGNYFGFNYATHRDGVAGLRSCRFLANANNNHCHFAMLNTSANHIVVDDDNEWGDSPNMISGYIGADVGTASASTSGYTLYRDIKGYGTMDSNLAPGGDFGQFSLFGTTTSTHGIDITGGCFAINGTCISGGAGVTGSGVTGALAAWSSASAITATSSPTANTFTATSTTATSTFPRLSATTAFNLIGDYITDVSAWFLTKLQAVTSAVLTGTWDFGGATFLEIPNGTGPTANDPGEIAHDTTDNQLVVDDYVMGRAVDRIWSVTVASTSVAFIEGGLLKVPTELDGYTMTAIRCSVQNGTSKVVAVEDESANSTEDITCATSVTSDDGSITNASVTAAEEMYVDFGATSGAVDYVTISVYGTLTRE